MDCAQSELMALIRRVSSEPNVLVKGAAHRPLGGTQLDRDTKDKDKAASHLQAGT